MKKEKAVDIMQPGDLVICRVNAEDAEYLTKDLQGKVGTHDLVTLQTGQAVARIDSHVVRLNTMPPLQIPQHHFRDEIMARCHQLYYLPSETGISRVR